MSFYTRKDSLLICRELLGMVLVANVGGQGISSGIIVETEAYCGAEDRACHAWNNRRTGRTEPMYASGGIAYVYLCYGIHALFNVVIREKDNPHAVLIRAIQPLEGVELMGARRKMKPSDHRLSSGPGKLTVALGIGLEQNGLPLGGPVLRIEDRGIRYADREVMAGARVGVESAGPDAKHPWRYRVRNNRWTSPAK